MLKYPLVKTFTVYSLFAFVLTAVVLSNTIISHLREDKLEHINEVLQFYLSQTDWFAADPVEWNQLLSSDQAAKLLNTVEPVLALYDIKAAAVFDSSGTLVRSSMDHSVATAFQVRPVLDQLFAAEKPYIRLEKDNHLNFFSQAHSSDVMDIFLPVRAGATIPAVLALQVPAIVIEGHVQHMISSIVLSLAGGLLLLFMLLIGILHESSKKMAEQHQDLAHQKTELEHSYQRLNVAYKGTIRALSIAVDARDPYTAGHSSRVTRIALRLGQVLNLTDDELLTLEYASMFHDIGKIGIPDRILNKPGRLTEDEYCRIKSHPDIGIIILENVDFLANVLPLIRHHHERFDGKGYPQHLVGDEIPLGSRILAIADTYDAMTSDRPYRKAFEHPVAVAEISSQRGLQFDPKLVDIWTQIEQEFGT